MAISYSYEILSLRKKNIESNTDTVYHVQWKMKGVDDTDDVFGEHHGAFPLDSPSGSFIAYDDLTEANVKSWVESKVNSNKTYLNHIKEQIDYEINRKREEAGTPGGVIGDVHTTEGKIELPWSS